MFVIKILWKPLSTQCVQPFGGKYLIDKKVHNTVVEAHKKMTYHKYISDFIGLLKKEYAIVISLHCSHNKKG